MLGEEINNAEILRGYSQGKHSLRWYIFYTNRNKTL